MRIGLSLAATEPRYNLLAQNIQALFADGSQGWWYDDDDLTTLFQDSAGTTPVTAVEQFVGLQLDKSKGLVLGPELVTNGDFSSGTADWTNRSTGTGTFSVSGGAAVVTGIDGTNRGWFTQTRTTVVGVYYKITFDYTHTSGTVNLIFGSAAGTGSLSLTSSGQKTIYLAASSAATFIGFQTAAGGGNGSIDNVSVRELPGNHRYAPASGNRPIWSKRVNLLTKTEQFDDAAWTKNNATVSANAAEAPNGTLTADKIVEDTATSRHGVSTALTNLLVPSILNTISISIKAGERNKFRILFSGSGNSDWAWVDLTTGIVTVPASGANGLSGTTVLQSNGFYRATFTLTPAVTGVIFFELLDGVPSSRLSTYTGDGTSGLFIWGADLRLANQATGLLPLYQQVNTSTDYDTNGFPGYLKADGVDDFLQTNSIDFTATDKVTLCAGVRKLSDAARAVVTELGSGLGVGFSLFAPNITTVTFAFRSFGGSGGATAETTATFAAPTTRVLTGVGEISTDTSILRVNGVQEATSATDQGAGNYPNQQAFFFRRTGLSSTFTGHEYGNVAVGKLLTADQLRALETYMNGLTKAY